MSTAPIARRTQPSRISPPSKSALCAGPLAPHLFQPAQNEPLRDLAALFDLKRSPGYYQPTAKVALLRREKKEPQDELFVDFSGREVQLELRAAGAPLASGAWIWQATAAGKPLSATGPWSEVCWQREKECDYLQIELPLSSNWKIERQMLLARKDQFLFLADALLSPGGANTSTSGTEPHGLEIHYAQSLPLAAESSFDLARETREGWLTAAGRRRAAVVPPALAEWRSEFCHADLAASTGTLTLEQASLGQNLYAPLWIDLDPRRLRRPLTWRRLTVAENLAIVPRDVATAYRIQSGREQWLVYRSLARAGNRSVLGHNTLASFICSRIRASGETEEILAIE
jgi:hypothetical protein